MTQYAKFDENGNLEPAPRNLNGISNWINNEQDVLNAGYYPVIYKEAPDGYFQSGWKLENEKIVPNFIEEHPKQELTYSEKRKRAYPTIEEQLDMIYWDMVKGTKDWLSYITVIKETYPKPKDPKED